MLEKYIDIIKPYIIELFDNDFSGHDISHLVRTMNIALKICEKENGDKLIVGISAFMHDIHRTLQNESGSFVLPEDSIPTVRSILDKTDLSSDIKDKICYCIENHEKYSFNGDNVSDLNTLIIQDADNLDAIGAIGIGRTFTYGDCRNVKVYDDTVSLEMDNEFTDSKNDPSTIHHFYHKLFRLKDNMNTKTGKELAVRRTEFMHLFVDEFLDEWNGKK